MKFTLYLAKGFGKVAAWFFGVAEWLDPDYDDEWNAIRDAVRRRYAELDEGWGDCALPSAPQLPLEVDDERRITDRCIETPPPPLPQAERRIFVVDGKRESVHPPRCDTPTYWPWDGGKWGRS